jgi:putative restriction endonuclease
MTVPEVRPAYEYSRDLIKSLKQQPLWGKELKDPEKIKKVRGQGFRKAVVKLYDHRCALCGIKMIRPKGHTFVEAAHIKPRGKLGDVVD